MLEIHCTFRAHHWRVEEKTRSPEIVTLLKGFHVGCAQETGVVVHGAIRC